MLKFTRFSHGLSVRAARPAALAVAGGRSLIRPTPMKLAVTLPHPSRPPTAVFPISWYTTTKEPPSKGPTPRPFPPRPDEVTTQSSVRHAIEPDTSAAGKEHNAVESLKSDVETVKDALALDAVPSSPYAFGLAGTLPYVATSLSTMFLSWNLSTDWPTSWTVLNSIMLSSDNALHWLRVLEPVQLGYGAVLISFLGAVHWGLELGSPPPKTASDVTRMRTRYLVSVAAPLAAFPTLFLPVTPALIAQFGAFTLLYLFDARAASKGWAPSWYGTYRFVLTFIVGGAIAISLIGRARLGTDLEGMGMAVGGGPAEPAGEGKEAVGGVDVSVLGLPDRMRSKMQNPGKDKFVNWERLEKEEIEERKRQEEEKKKQEEEKKGGKSGAKKAKKEGKDEKNKEKKDDEGKDDKGKENAEGEDEADTKKDEEKN